MFFPFLASNHRGFDFLAALLLLLASPRRVSTATKTFREQEQTSLLRKTSGSSSFSPVDDPAPSSPAASHPNFHGSNFPHSIFPISGEETCQCEKPAPESGHPICVLCLGEISDGQDCVLDCPCSQGHGIHKLCPGENDGESGFRSWRKHFARFDETVLCSGAPAQRRMMTVPCAVGRRFGYGREQDLHVGDQTNIRTNKRRLLVLMLV